MQLARTVGKELRNPSQYTPEEFVAAADRALKKYPDEWVIYYTLGDNFQQLGLYAQALQATQKCVEIRPDDIRSAYALATSYNILTRAAWTEKEDQVSRVFKLLLGDIDKFDKRYSQAGLDHTGMAVETAAVQAIRWFEQALRMKSDRQSKEQIKDNLKTLYIRFPHLRR